MKTRKRVANGLMVAIVAASVAAFVGTVQAALVNSGELVTNGDFETGDLTGWTTVVGNPENLANNAWGIECFGNRFYASGSSGGTSLTATVSQAIDVSADAATIDAGNVTATLAAALGSWENADIATVTVSFLDATSADLGSSLVVSALNNPVLSSGSEGLTAAGCQEAANGSVPTGTRTIKVTISSTCAGGYNDGYANNVSIQLTYTPPRRDGDLHQVRNRPEITGRNHSGGDEVLDRKEQLTIGWQETRCCYQ